MIGHNSRLDELQAALLRVKLSRLDGWNKRRAEISEMYIEALKDSDLVTPITTEGAYHIYHLFILQSEKRDELIKHLSDAGVATGVYYPVPMHLQKVYKSLGYSNGDLPNAEYLSERTFAIPLFAELTDEEIRYIISKLLEF